MWKVWHLCAVINKNNMQNFEDNSNNDKFSDLSSYVKTNEHPKLNVILADLALC